MSDESQLYTPAHHSGQMDQRLNSTNYIHPQETNLLNIAKSMDYDKEGRPVQRVVQSNLTTSDKGRLRVSEKDVFFHNTSLYDTGTDVWDGTTALSATITHDPNKNAVVMMTTSTTNSEAVRQTRKVMPYVPGRTVELLISFQVTQATGARTRVGIFDDNNGIYFEKDHLNDFYCAIRSTSTGTLVEDRVIRADWNGDKLDGTDPSAILVVPGRIQMIVFEYEWFGSGAVHVSLVIDGAKRTIHTFYHANRATTSWSATPFLPIRFEVKNITSTMDSYLTLYGVSYALEANSVNLGVPKITGIPLPGKTLSTAFTYEPTLSIRLKSSQLSAVAFLEEVQAFTVDNTFLTFRIIKNATLSNGGTLTWTDYNTSTSSVEINTNATTFTGGEVVALGVVPSNGAPYMLDGNTGVFQIGRTNMGTASDIYTLALSPAKNNVIALGTLRWREQR